MAGADELRQQALKRRDALGAAQRQRKSDEAWKRLVEVPAFQRAGQALVYVAFGSELDTGMMRRLCRELGMAVACPRIRPAEKAMAFHLLEDDEQLVSGPYGILQPAPELPLADLGRLSVVLVPGIAFDRKGGRLGHGAGYYDRWLAGPGQGLPAIGLAFQEQVFERVPQEPHDVALDWLVTDQESVDCPAARGA